MLILKKHLLNVGFKAKLLMSNCRMC